MYYTVEGYAWKTDSNDTHNFVLPEQFLSLTAAHERLRVEANRLGSQGWHHVDCSIRAVSPGTKPRLVMRSHYREADVQSIRQEA